MTICGGFVGVMDPRPVCKSFRMWYARVDSNHRPFAPEAKGQSTSPVIIPAILSSPPAQPLQILRRVPVGLIQRPMAHKRLAVPGGHPDALRGGRVGVPEDVP